MTDEPYPRTNDRRVVSWLLFGLLVLFGGLYLAGYLFTSDRVPRDTTVAGVDIGGLRPAAARTALSDALAEQRYAPITVRALGPNCRVVNTTDRRDNRDVIHLESCSYVVLDGLRDGRGRGVGEDGRG